MGYGRYLVSDDRRLISSGADHSVRIWDVGTETYESTKWTRGRCFCRRASSGRILSSSMDTIIKLWQIKLTTISHYNIPNSEIEQHAIEIEWEAPPAMGDRIGYIIQRREGAPNLMTMQCGESNLEL